MCQYSHWYALYLNAEVTGPRTSWSSSFVQPTRLTDSQTILSILISEYGHMIMVMIKIIIISMLINIMLIKIMIIRMEITCPCQY